MDYSSLIVFDFDHTICDYNTYATIVGLIPEGYMPEDVRGLYQSNWFEYINRIFDALHNISIKEKQIENAIVALPVTRGMVELLTTLNANGHEIIIISDLNSLVINWWLKSKKLDHTVSRIFTNPASVDRDGRVRINMYHTQFSCNMSSMNLCKGKILMDFIDEQRTQDVYYDRIVYIGDGKDDLCPILRLSKGDLACPRKGFLLIDLLIKKSRSIPLSANIMPWQDGKDLLKRLEEVLRVVKKN